VSRDEVYALRGITLLALGVLVLLQAPDYYSLWTIYPQRPIFGHDVYGAYLPAAAILASGELASLYSPPLTHQWMVAHQWPIVFDFAGGTPLPYPPLTALMFVPLLGPSLPSSVWNWFYLSHLWWGLAVLLALSPFWPGQSPLRRILWWGGATLLGLMAAPSIDGLLAGQLGTWMTFLIAAFAIAYARGRRTAAAAILALAISCKFNAAPMALYLLCKRDFRTFAMTGVFALLWTLPVLAYTGFGPGLQLCWTYYFKLLPTLSDTGGAVSDQSLLGGLAALLGPGPPAKALGLFGCGLMFWWTARAIKPGGWEQPRVLGEIGLWLMLQLLCVGRSWPHYHVAVLLTAVFLYLVARRLAEPYYLLMAAVFLLLGLAVTDGEVTGNSLRLQMRVMLLTWKVPCLLLLGFWFTGSLALRRLPSAGLSGHEEPLVDEGQRVGA